MYSMLLNAREMNIRPGDMSDSDEDGDDDDFCFEEPRDQPPVEIILTVLERFQSIVMQGKFAEFELMFKEELNSDVEYRFPSDWTPLMYTCFHGQPDMAHYLLELGADPNAHTDSVTPLMLLCSNSFATNEEIRNMGKELLAKGGILNLGDRDGCTPVMRAIQNGRFDLLKLFVDSNANIEVRDRHGWTAIFWSVHCNQTAILEYLISKGARVTEVDRANRTLLDVAEAHENGDSVKILEPYFNDYGSDNPIYLDEEPDYWLEYYPGLRKNQNQLYKNEMHNMLFGMNCDHLKPMIVDSGIDLRQFLLLEEKDMIKIGIDMKYERDRLKEGLRAFHLRNWKLKSVSGLYARQTENYNLCECMESAACNLIQFYIMEASLAYTIREFNKIRYAVQRDSRDSYEAAVLADSVQNLIANINNIKGEIGYMLEFVQYIRKKSPQLVEIHEEEPPDRLQSSVQAILVGTITITLSYFTIQGTKYCVSFLFKNRFFLK